MNRTVKQFIYGLGYLIVISLLIWWIVPSSDTGGSVVDKPKESSQDDVYVNMVSEPKFFQTENGNSSFLVKLKNPNNEKAVSFSYKFVPKDNTDGVLGELTGSDYLRPGVTEYVVELDLYDSLVRSVDFEVTGGSYEETSEMLREDVSVNNVNIVVEEKRAKISGAIKNESLLMLPEVKVVGVLADEFGFMLFAGRTILSDIKSFGERDFEIFLPVDERIKDNLYTTSTQVYINLE